MANVSMKQTVHTVGELIDALKDYDADLPVNCDMDRCVTVYLSTPALGETYGEPEVEICGDDPWGEDDDD